MATASYDPHGDTLLISLVPGADGPDTEGEEVAPGIMLLYKAGRLIGLEILPASKIVAPEALKVCTFCK
jgi:uncharacterized protein YuzE